MNRKIPSRDNSLKPEPSKEEGVFSKKDLLSHNVSHFDAKSVGSSSEFLEALRNTGFQSRNLAECYNVLISMLRDVDRPLICLGLAGAMIPAGMKKIIRDMVESHIIDVLVTTGANMYHDLYEAMGNSHYLAQSHVSDTELRKLKIDRMLDVYADDEAFVETDIYIKKFTDKLEPKSYSSREFLSLLGQSLNDNRSILHTAWKEECPIFCPSIADSSIGIGLALHKFDREKGGGQSIVIDVIKDNLETAHARNAVKKGGAIFIGGGVPKNFIQQITPMAEVLNLNVEGLSYGIQVTTDDPKWGGLSGCTFKESQSWGKYGTDANFATVYMDATIALPLLFLGITENQDNGLPRSKLNLLSKLDNVWKRSPPKI